MNKIKEARIKAKITQQEMSELLEIPKRTIEDWDREKSSPPEWAKKLIIEKLENLSQK